MKVTLNGPAGAGKGTIARAVTMATGMSYVDLGLIFRSTVYALHTQACSTLEAVKELVQSKRMQHLWDGQNVSVVLDGQDITIQLYESEMALAVARLSAIPSKMLSIAEIANLLLEGYDDLICDGKSAGTSLLPDAEFKFYITAEEQERALRRFKDLLQRGFTVSFEQVLSDVRQRDQLDMQRAYDPLTVPQGAHILDTTHLPVEESVRIIRTWIGR